jgi:(5-formylfuran-3-yl)methyl phosphate synthase
VTRLLVSVRDVDEAVGALTAGAGLIDAKEPRNGSLGPPSVASIRAIVAAVDNRAPTSAVAGDHTDLEALVAAARSIAASGADFVKVGLHRELLRPEALAHLGRELEGWGRFIAVCFAEERLDHGLVEQMSLAGFAGAMIDTYGKRAGGLVDLRRLDDLDAFVRSCRKHRLLSGLAGSLRIEDIDTLAPLRADYLGFRGGLCQEGDRSLSLDFEKVALASARLSHAQQRHEEQAIP